MRHVSGIDVAAWSPTLTVRTTDGEEYSVTALNWQEVREAILRNMS